MQTENDVRCRISRVLAENGLTENKLADGDSSTQKRLNRQLSHDAAITVDTLLRVLSACPDVSADYLLTGKETVPANADLVSGLIQTISQQGKRIAELEKLAYPEQKKNVG